MTMAMMPMALATGPESESCTVCSGVSQGMAVELVVPARAGEARIKAAATTRVGAARPDHIAGDGAGRRD